MRCQMCRDEHQRRPKHREADSNSAFGAERSAGASAKTVILWDCKKSMTLAWIYEI